MTQGPVSMIDHYIKTIISEAVQEAVAPLATRLTAIEARLDALKAPKATSKVRKDRASDEKLVEQGPQFLQILCEKRHAKDGCSTSVLARELGIQTGALARLAQRFIDGLGVNGEDMPIVVTTFTGNAGGFHGRIYRISSTQRDKAMALAKKLKGSKAA